MKTKKTTSAQQCIKINLISEKTTKFRVCILNKNRFEFLERKTLSESSFGEEARRCWSKRRRDGRCLPLKRSVIDEYSPEKFKIMNFYWMTNKSFEIIRFRRIQVNGCSKKCYIFGTSISRLVVLAYTQGFTSCS